MLIPALKTKLIFQSFPHGVIFLHKILIDLFTIYNKDTFSGEIIIIEPFSIGQFIHSLEKLPHYCLIAQLLLYKPNDSILHTHSIRNKDTSLNLSTNIIGFVSTILQFSCLIQKDGNSNHASKRLVSYPAANLLRDGLIDMRRDDLPLESVKHQFFDKATLHLRAQKYTHGSFLELIKGKHFQCLLKTPCLRVLEFFTSYILKGIVNFTTNILSFHLKPPQIVFGMSFGQISKHKIRKYKIPRSKSMLSGCSFGVVISSQLETFLLLRTNSPHLKIPQELPLAGN